MHICDLDVSSAGTLGYKVPRRWGFTYANFSINLTESCFVKLDIVNINGEFLLFLIADMTSINYLILLNMSFSKEETSSELKVKLLFKIPIESFRNNIFAFLYQAQLVPNFKITVAGS
jgi:hypothetical protein